jgi:hypothetical protein
VALFGKGRKVLWSQGPTNKYMKENEQIIQHPQLRQSNHNCVLFSPPCVVCMLCFLRFDFFLPPRTYGQVKTHISGFIFAHCKRSHSGNIYTFITSFDCFSSLIIYTLGIFKSHANCLTASQDNSTSTPDP